MKLRLLITLFSSVFIVHSSVANTYFVVNNLNNGGGSLRAAINDANNHAGRDTIAFNISDGSVASRTIILNTALPSLDETTDIDATSQSKGDPFGISLAMIQLTTQTTGIAQGLDVEADSCEIYGFFINNFDVGILANAAYLRIGSVSHGNVIFDCTTACININVTDHAIIISNLIGVDTAGALPVGVVGDGIQVNNSYKVTIGGHSSEAANVISGNSYGIRFDDSAYSSVVGNLIGTNTAGTVARPNSYGIRGTGINTGIEIGGDSAYERNIISGNSLVGIYGAFGTTTITNNYIGLAADGFTALGNGTQGIYLTLGSIDNVIGGDGIADPNVIAYNSKEAIYFQNSTCLNNTIRRNSVYCNSQTSGSGGFNFNNGNNDLTPPALVIASTSGVSGTTYPNGLVDIYGDDDCSHCEGKTWIGSVTASNTGVFVLNASLPASITATITDTAGNTSEFSSCVNTTNTACVAAQFSIEPTAVCTGTTSTFVDESVPAAGTSLTSWSWNFGDGFTSTLQSPTHQYGTTGTFTITLIVTNNEGCSDTTTKTITAAVPPIAAFSSIDESCVGVAVSFTDESTAGSGANLTNWQWQFGDGFLGSGQHPTHSYGLPGTYTVTLTATNSNGCTDDATATINIYDQPAAGFTYSQSGLIVYFTNTSVSSSQSTYSWSFGDGAVSNAESPYHAYSTFGVYNVCLTVFDSICSTTDSVCQIVDLPTQVNNLQNNGIEVFPTPANDQLIISGAINNANISLVNSLGQEVFSAEGIFTTSTYTLNTQSLANGEYILLIRSTENVTAKKIFVLHEK